MAKMPKMLTKWLKALRSGKYKQARGVMARTNGRMCCLGVLTDACLGGVPEYDKTRYGQPDQGFYRPVDEALAKMGFFEIGTGIDRDFFTRMNDDRMYSFERIADEIEALWKRLHT